MHFIFSLYKVCCCVITDKPIKYLFWDKEVIRTHCIMGSFSIFFASAAFFNINFFKKLFREYHQSVKQFGSRSGPMDLSVQIWVQTAKEQYQHADNVSRQRVKEQNWWAPAGNNMRQCYSNVVIQQKDRTFPTPTTSLSSLDNELGHKKTFLLGFLPGERPLRNGLELFKKSSWTVLELLWNCSIMFIGQ